MIEFNQGVLGSLGLLISIIYSVFQWFGGRSEDYFGIKAREWSRIVSPIFLCLSIIGLSILSNKFNLWYLLSVPAYLAVHMVGYGGDELWEKILKRSLWSLLRTTASLTFAIVAGTWTLFALQMIIGLIASVVLGTFNPNSPPQEEGMIKFLNVVLVPYMVL